MQNHYLTAELVTEDLAGYQEAAEADCEERHFRLDGQEAE